MKGLYIHIPFCRSKCGYCDFLSFAIVDDALRTRYLQALQSEMKRVVGQRFDTVFIGGGTPSSLTAAELEGVLENLWDCVQLEKGAEFSVEANPGTVDREKLQILRAYGVNRLSFGAQSFDNTVLRRIGRRHEAKDVSHALQLAREAGFENINLDLIAGLPGQSHACLMESVVCAIAEEIQHLSLYSLILEEGTPMERAVTQGELHLPDEDEELAMLDAAQERLDAAGFHCYEISNYAQTGYQCQHNLNYWRGGEYAALGLGASSAKLNAQGDLERYKNETDILRYCERIESGQDVAMLEETVDREGQLFEQALLGLRLVNGIEREAFFERFGETLETAYGAKIQRYVERGLMVCDKRGIRLTPHGLRLQSLVLRDWVEG